MKLDRSVALVTGANRGLGRAFAQALLEAGAAKVYAAARDPATIDLPGVQAMRLDVTRADEVAEAARRCADVSLLINNAGIAQPSAVMAGAALEATRAQLETNVMGTWAMSRAFAPVLAAHGGGAIVNMLSVLSWVSMPAIAGYCVSKAAAWSLTNALRHELAAQGTLVVGVHAAFIDTDMARHVPVPKTSPREVVQQVLSALESGQEEVLVDALTRSVKQGLSAESASYLAPAQR